MVDDKVNDDANATRMAGFQQLFKIIQRAVIRVDRLVIGDVVTMVGRRGIDWHEPQRADSQVIRGLRVAVVQIVQLLNDALKIADAIAVAVFKGAHKDFIEDHIIPPARNILRLSDFRGCSCCRGSGCRALRRRGCLGRRRRGLAGSQQQKQ